MNDNNGIHFINEKVTEKMKVFDIECKNIFKDYLTLIMDFSPYISKIVFGKTMKNLDYRIIYVKEGSAVIKFNMIEYEMKQGSLVFLNKNSTIITKWVSPDYNPLTVGFDITAVAQKYADLAHRDSVFIQTSGRDRESMLTSFNLLYNIAQNTGRMDMGLEGVLVAMLNIVNNLKDNELENVFNLPNKKNSIVRQFFYYLNKEKYPKRNVQSYADEIGVSPDHLAKTLKKETEHSPSHWIDQRTVQMAQVMMCENPKMTLDDIADALHCGTDSQFIKLYKKITGETPGMYRSRFNNTQT